MLKLNKYAWLLGLIVVFTGHPSFADDISEIQLLRESNPSEAVTLAENLWENSKHKQHYAIGIELLLSYKKNKQYNLVPALAEKLLSQHPENTVQNAHILSTLIYAKTSLKTFDKNLEARAENLLAKLADLSSKSELQANLGYFYYVQFKLAKAENYYFKSIKNTPDSEQSKLAKRYQNYAVMLAQQGLFAKAVPAFLKVVEINKQLGRPASVALLKNLGAISLNMEKYDDSINFTNQAIQAAQEDSPLLSSLYSNLGAAYFQKKLLGKAIVNFEKALSFGKNNPSALVNLGNAYRETGRLIEALNNFREAEKIYIDHKEPEYIAIVKKNIGETLIKAGKRKKAQPYLLEALELYKKYNFPIKKLELYPVLIENLEALGDFKQALMLMKEFKAIDNKIHSAESLTQANELQSKYDLIQRNAELKQSKIELALKKQENISLNNQFAMDRNIRRSLLAIMLALILALSLLVRSHRYRGKTNAELAEMNYEIQAQHAQVKLLNKKLKKSSEEDHLTGLKNRRYISEQIDLHLTQNSKLSPTCFSVAIIDLDYFKQVNDNYGHPFGDHVLEKFAEILKKHAHKDDLVARWGGEEFLYVSFKPGCDHIIKFCGAVHESFSSIVFSINDKNISLSCSTGFASLQQKHYDEHTFEYVQHLADTALYRAKNNGRNQSIGLYLDLIKYPQTKASEDIDTLIKDKSLIYFSG